jgi:Spy/CpxP family protein refolding chaperone
MNKVIALIAAGSFAAGTFFASGPGEGMLKVQNETKEMKMTCSIPMANLNLTSEQRKKMDVLMAEHHKAGCTEASETKYMEGAKAIMTPEQYAKSKQEYDRSPRIKM